MKFKHEINILFFCLYLGTVGKYILKQVLSPKLTETYISLLIDILIISLSISFIKLNSRYLIFLIFFILISSISYAFSANLSLTAHTNGTREIVLFFCYFLIFDELYNSKQIENTNNKFSTFAYIFLALQIPISIIQFIQFGPGDAVGGTFEVGGSGLLTLTIFLLVFYLIENDIKTVNERIKKGFSFIVFLIPIALNETKISMLLLFLFFLSFSNLRNIRSNIFIGLCGILAIFSFSLVYSTNENVMFNNPIEALTSIDYLENYLLGDEDEYSIDVPRFTKLVISLQKLSEDGDLFFGKDYGAFMFNNSGIRSEFSRRYDWLLKGSLPYSLYLLITGGFSLLSLICLMIFKEIFSNYNSIFRINSLPLLVFSASLFFVVFFYNDAFRSPVFSFIFVFILFYSKRYKNLKIPN